MSDKQILTRRSLVLGGLGAIAGTAFTAGFKPALAKAPKETVAYQTKPKGEQNCANCMFYVAPAGDQPGGCQIVAGEIGAEHWCNLWAAK